MSIHLRQILLTAVMTAVVGLLVMESYQTTPWLADKAMRWSVRLRYADNSERAAVRGEELASLLDDLPTLLKLPTAGAFFFRALAYRLAHRRGRARREPRAGQRSLGARFRIVLIKAGLVFACTSTVSGIEFSGIGYFATSSQHALSFHPLSVIISLAFLIGISAAIEVATQSSRLYSGLMGGIIYALFSVIVFGNFDWVLGGVVFGLATAFVGVCMGKFKNRAGVALGVMAHFVGATLLFLSLLNEMSSVPELIGGFSGFGLMAGTLAGFAVAVERGELAVAARSGSKAA